MWYVRESVSVPAVASVISVNLKFVCVSEWGESSAKGRGGVSSWLGLGGGGVE